jgi:hypothetical protein
VITIIDNFLPVEVQDQLLNYVTDARLPFFMNEKTVDPQDAWSDINTKDSLQLTHTMVADGVPNPSWSYFDILWRHFVFSTGINKPIQRVKANITFPLKGYEGTYSGAHVDHLYPNGHTAIYYMNDADGDTIFFERPDDQFSKSARALTQITRVTPKKGRLVYFDSHIIHSGQLPSRSKFRCVVNLNMYNKGAA